ncbi:hypothetical protein PMAYCL1PPCAC_19210, partial [Pristionchus mayeri]
NMIFLEIANFFWKFFGNFWNHHVRYAMYLYEVKIPKVDIDPRIRVVPVNGSCGLDGEGIVRDQASMAFKDIPVWSKEFREMMGRFLEMYKSCDVFIKNKEFLAHIKNSHYDIAFTHMYNFC